MSGCAKVIKKKKGEGRVVHVPSRSHKDDLAEFNLVDSFCAKTTADAFETYCKRGREKGRELEFGFFKRLSK